MERVQSSRLVATILGIFSILFWGTSIAISRRLMERVGYFTAAASANIAAGALSCAVSAPSLRKVFRLPVRYLAICGGLVVFYTGTIYYAAGTVARQEIPGIIIINYLWPGLTVLLSAPILGYKMKVWLLPGIIMAFAGAATALTQGTEALSWAAFAASIARQPASYIAALAAALAWALFSNLSRRLAGDAAVSAMPVFLLATGIALVAVRAFYGEESRWSPAAVGEMLYMAILPTTLAYIFWDFAIRNGSFTVVAVLSYFTPLLSTITAVVFLGVTATGRLWVACALVIAGAAVCKLSVRETTEASAEKD